MKPYLFSISLYDLPIWVYLLLAAIPFFFAWVSSEKKYPVVRSLFASLVVFLLFGVAFWVWSVPLIPVSIASYGVCLSIAVFLGLSLAFMRLPDTMANEGRWVLLGAVLFGFLGARVGYSLLHAAETPSPEFLQIASGGMSSLFGFLFGCFYAFWVSRRRGLSFLRLCHAALPALLVAFAIGRLGCFLHGCDFGKPTDSFFAVTYPAEQREPVSGQLLESPISMYQHSPEFAARFPDSVYLLPAYDDRSQGEPLSLPVHPLPLYELFGLLGLSGLFWVFRRSPFVVSGSFVGFFVLRVVIELFRGDTEVLWNGYTVFFWVSCAGVLVSIWFLWDAKRNVLRV